MKMSEENIKEDKIEQIESFIQELEEIIPGSYEEYMSNYISRAACERYFEKIIEAVVDLAFIVIREKELNVPKDENSSFFVLSDKKIISEDLAKELKEAKGMRNIIAHEYGKLLQYFQNCSESILYLCLIYMRKFLIFFIG